MLVGAARNRNEISTPYLSLIISVTLAIGLPVSGRPGSPVLV
jgi:hypothetical protein